MAFRRKRCRRRWRWPKYADGLPLYLQEAIYARPRRARSRADGAVNGQGRLRARAVGRAHPGLRQAGRAGLCQQDDFAGAGAGSGKIKTAYLWAYVRDDRPFLQGNGYAAYYRLARSDRGNDRATLAACWSHVRRKFYECTPLARPSTPSTVAQMAPLWTIKQDRARPSSGSSDRGTSGEIRRHSRRPLCAVGTGAAKTVGQIEARRGKHG
ncbi:IS66 family transposase [Mesorhizobium escarrei]|uniref:Transposase IS66 central domain-containing protein n=1 Tax=Mesorhizobium escarrei TaxID=666018 RepID=A0ABN8JKS9_9HYPH|nr:hypothetical protein MES5069_1360013 [Mesorhizobium escarrei]